MLESQINREEKYSSEGFRFGAWARREQIQFKLYIFRGENALKILLIFLFRWSFFFSPLDAVCASTFHCDFPNFQSTIKFPGKIYFYNSHDEMEITLLLKIKHSCLLFSVLGMWFLQLMCLYSKRSVLFYRWRQGWRVGAVGNHTEASFVMLRKKFVGRGGKLVEYKSASLDCFKIISIAFCSKW